MKSIIFDFNGTLFQDTPMHLASWGAFFRSRDIPFTPELFYQYMCGPPNSDILRRFIDPRLSDAQIARLSEEKERIYRGIIVDDPKLQVLTPGAAEMLDALKLQGVPFAIATGADRANMDFYMKVLHIDRWFDNDRVFCAHIGMPGKPDPAIYRTAMETLDFDPAETVVVEDAMAGIHSAVGAGVKSIVAIDTTLGPDAFSGIPEIVAIVHDFHDFNRVILSL